MIRLTRLNNQPLAVNSNLIKFVENAPDTVITLTTGEKIVVRESPEQVLDRVIEFQRAILSEVTSQGRGGKGSSGVSPSSEDKQDQPLGGCARG